MPGRQGGGAVGRGQRRGPTCKQDGRGGEGSPAVLTADAARNIVVLCRARREGAGMGPNLWPREEHQNSQRAGAPACTHTELATDSPTPTQDAPWSTTRSSSQSGHAPRAASAAGGPSGWPCDRPRPPSGCQCPWCKAQRAGARSHRPFCLSGGETCRRAFGVVQVDAPRVSKHQSMHYERQRSVGRVGFPWGQLGGR